MSLSSFKAVMGTAAAVACIDALVRFRAPGFDVDVSNATRAFLKGGMARLARCSAAAGIRIPGAADGPCSPKGTTTACTDNGVCANKTVASSTLYTCKCNKGFFGKF